MDLTLTNLKTAGVGFKKNYQTGFDSVKPMWSNIASELSSSTSSNEYGWLGDMSGLTEWIGDRTIDRIGQHDYSIKNRKFQKTVAFLIDDLDDDNVGLYANRMQGIGEAAARHPDELVFETLEKGFSSQCYDGQNFFDEDHIVIGKDKKEKSVSNLYGAGQANPAWYLMDTSRSLKPLVRQVRMKAKFQAMTDISNQHVFMKDEVLYGVKTRENTGYGFWQMAFASKKEFNAANFAEVYTAMKSQEGDFGKKLALQPNVLLVPNNLEDAANALMNAEKIGGEMNVHRNKVKVIACPWLSN